MLLTRPLLWRLRDHPVHFLGTFHLGPPGGFAFPPRALELIDSAAAVYLEVDPFGQPTRDIVHRSEGTLEDDIGSSRFRRLQELMPRDNDLAQLAPAGIELRLGIQAYRARGLEFDLGIDRMLYRRADGLEKSIHFLETMSDQEQALLAGDKSEMIAGLDLMLANPGVLQQLVDNLIWAYLQGDDRVLSEIRNLMATLRPSKARALLQNREERWVPLIRGIVESRRPTLIAVGAIHFAEPDGLLSHLAPIFPMQRFEAEAA